MIFFNLIISHVGNELEVVCMEEIDQSCVLFHCQRYATISGEAYDKGEPRYNNFIQTICQICIREN